MNGKKILKLYKIVISAEFEMQLKKTDDKLAIIKYRYDRLNLLKK